MHEKRKESITSRKKTSPQNIMQESEKRQLLGSFVLQTEIISYKLKLLLSKSLGEGINSLLTTTKLPKINDPIMNELFNKVHVDLDVFGLMLHHWIF